MSPAPPHVPGHVVATEAPSTPNTPEIRPPEELSKQEREKIELLKPFTSKIVWFNAIGFVVMHILGLISVPICLTFHTHIFTQLWAALVGILSSAGVLIGAHRMYSHRSFKGTWQLRLFLLTCHTIAGQNCMYVWVRDHRLHHKYSDTNADPHNARRGFWYSHVGWLCMKKHPLVIEKGKTIDLSDLEQDKLLMFQKRWYKPLYVIFALAIPVYVPMLLWNELFLDSLLCAYFIRYIIVLNITWSVNSAAHLWGTKPYDKDIMPRENKFVGYVGMGEGWHNYHHAFPWDYRAAEFGLHHSPTTQIIEYFARKGWAYDLKSASADMVKRRIERTGDGTHMLPEDHHHHVEEAEPHPDDVNKMTTAATPNLMNGKANGLHHDDVAKMTPTASSQLMNGKMNGVHTNDVNKMAAPAAPPVLLNGKMNGIETVRHRA